MRLDRTLIGVLMIGILALAPSACAISISISGDVGGFTQNIDAGEKDAVYSSTVIAANSMSHSIEGSGSFRESHRVSNTAGANAGVGVDIRQAEWYSYSYDLWPGEGSSWKASKFAQVAASEQLDVLNARYIQAYANAHNSKGYSAGVSTVISDPGREASLNGYRNLAMASKNEAMASQTADGAFAMDGFIQADSGADFIQLKSRPLQFRWDTADASIRVDSGSVEGYSDLASASAHGVMTSQQIDAATGEQIRTRSESESWTASLFQGLKTANAKVSTRAEGDISGYNAGGGSSEGYAGADQSGHIVGTFTSAALAGKASKTRTSNYGEEYDFDMQARKDASGSYATGTLDYYVDNVNPLANRIQGAVDASESGDAVNVAAGTYYENVQIDKSLKIKGAGASETIVDGQQSGSVFTIGRNNPNADVALTRMTIQGGTGTPVEIWPGFSSLWGGGIFNCGKMKLNDSIISGNNAENGGGIFNEGIASLERGSIFKNNANTGGGILNYGTINLNGTSIDHNIAAHTIQGDFGNGGGIYNTGTLTGMGSVISENKASFGGGIYNTGTSTITGSTVSGNFAYHGGGIYSDGTDTFIRCNVSENNAYYFGGGIYIGKTGRVTVTGSKISENVAEYGWGGGIINSGTANVIDSIISKNTARDYGGGIYNAGTSTITGSTVSGNTADYLGGGILNFGTVIVTGSNISKNTAYNGGGISNAGGRAFITCSNISENTAYNGGGIYNYGIVAITCSNISGNNAMENGGGIFNFGATTVSGSTISLNKAFYGGGIYNTKNDFYPGTLDLQSGLVEHNIAGLNGGGIYNLGTLIGNISIVHDNTPDQIAPNVDWLPAI